MLCLVCLLFVCVLIVILCVCGVVFVCVCVCECCVWCIGGIECEVFSFVFDDVMFCVFDV